jgi:5-methylcytosine-specific restriction endonuclease McrA
MKEKNNPGKGWSFTEEQQLITDYDHRCAYCGNKFENLTMDHVIPLSKGGRHEIDNIVPACRFCNGSKHNKPLLIWMLKRMENAT